MFNKSEIIAYYINEFMRELDHFGISIPLKIAPLSSPTSAY